MEIPDWLAKRRGDVRRGLNDATWYVMLDDHPFYKLFATCAGGKWTCAVTQTNNGRRLDQRRIYPSRQAALEGGLTELRKQLGW